VAAVERDTTAVRQPTAVLGSEETAVVEEVTANETAADLPVLAEATPVPTATEDTDTDMLLPATITNPVAATQPSPDDEQFIATTTNAVPARTQAVSDTGRPVFGWLGYMATSPQSWLQALYATLSFFVLGVLLLSFTVEWRRQHPVQVAYSLGLLAVMGGLYYLQTIVTTGATIALAG
jgi:hypothetical protein